MFKISILCLTVIYVFNFQPDEDLEDPDERHNLNSDKEMDGAKHRDETPRYIKKKCSLFSFNSYMPAADKTCFFNRKPVTTSIQNVRIKRENSESEVRSL